MASLLRLSNELLDRICEDCDKASIKNLRLTSGRLRGVANRHLIGELVLHYNQESLDLLDILATKHDDITKGIQSLWLQADRLKDLPTFTSWDAERKKQHPEHFLACQDISEEGGDRESVSGEGVDMLGTRSTGANDHLRSRYRHYRTLLAQQADIDNTNILRDRAGSLFRACPGLTSMWITYGGDGDRESTVSKDLSFKKGFIIPHDNRAADDDQGIIAPLQLLLAAADSGRKFSTIVFGNVHYSLLLQPASVQSKIASVMEHVERFRWDIGETFSKWIPAGNPIREDELHNMCGTFARGRFLTFLDSFKNVRSLVLNRPDMGFRTEPIALANVVGDIFFPTLEAFSISWVLMTSGDLIEFLMKHKESLKRLRLCNLFLRAGYDVSWNAFFARTGGKLPKLERVCLRGIFGYDPRASRYIFGWRGGTDVGTPFATRMERYLLSGEGEVPQQGDLSEISAPMDESEREKRLGSAAVPEIRPFSRRAHTKS